MRFRSALLICLSAASPALAAHPLRLSPEQALAADAERYAAAFGVSAEEAGHRLDQQRASTVVTDRLRVRYRERLASISVVHRPDWHLLVRLTPGEQPANTVETAGDLPIPVRFTTDAAATRAAGIRLLDQSRYLLPLLIPGYRGAGLDPRTGGLVVMQRPASDQRPASEVESLLAARLGLPVRVRRLDAVLVDSAAIGGGRVEGPNAEGRRFRCTTGFVVRDAAGKLGITTAAHCPDTLIWRATDGEERLLPMLGAWGAAQNDIQIHGRIGPAEPLVFSDRDKKVVRPIITWATRPMTRPGDWLCLRGESSGYACSEVELTDFAPPGDLCGGLCTSSWVTMRGPECRRGDSGAPIFLGSVAYGTLKGGAYTASGGCAFSYYQSVDYLPEGWRLLTAR
ncbi:S1 family peptidase [Sphingomonas glaciei]|uniref:S1 family peptidase n=1 Tax=Sphingomonas glaciei TaxID=2938948 RepID=A0ABY5MVC1_9SPHN|nr:S1 family peptidase [Sphingomonas glaciei]UUR07736.1 S1 family peptidase [Sphingomonas glaciei]